MKISLILGFLLLITAPLYGQMNDNYFENYHRKSDRGTQTLLTKSSSFGGFGSLVYGVTDVNGQAAYLTGRRFALVINIQPEHTLNLGIGSYRTRSNFDPVDWNVSGVFAPELETDYSGFEVEYINKTRRLVHVGVQLLAGSGEVQYTNRNILVEKTKDSYFVLQPGLSLNVNITSWLRFNAATYYRFASNVDLAGTSDSDLSGFSGVLGFRIGAF
jgi:hypothetical protein